MVLRRGSEQDQIWVRLTILELDNFIYTLNVYPPKNFHQVITYPSELKGIQKRAVEVWLWNNTDGNSNNINITSI